MQTMPREGSIAASLQLGDFPGGSENMPLTRLDQLAENFVSGLELPGFDIPLIRLIDDEIDIVSKAHCSNWPPDVDSLILEFDIDVNDALHRKSPLPGPYLNPGPPT